MIELAVGALAVLLIGALEHFLDQRPKRSEWALPPSPEHNVDRIVAYYARLGTRRCHKGDEPPFLPRLRRGIRLQTELAMTGRMTPTT